MYNRIYMTRFLTKIFKMLTKNLDFRTKTSSLTPFLVSSYFSSHPITALLKILGGGYMGRPPTSNFGSTVPPVPPKSPPMHSRTLKLHARHNCSPLAFVPCISPCFTFPPISENFFGSRGKLPRFDLFPQNFLISIRQNF